MKSFLGLMRHAIWTTKEVAMLLRVIVLAAFFLALPGAPLAAEEALFPFVISYDAPDNVTNVSAWLERPAGKHGFVRSEGAKLTTDAGPIRFWATNLCFDACFPEKRQAERVAARLARLGINCVRMHHMDMDSIFKGSRNKLTLSPEQLDKLDYLVFQLREHGIYTNLNLHVSRWLDEAEGFSGRGERPEFDKGLDNFEPRMIDFQKKYARDLLTHVNRYTRKLYAQEPAIAFVEINNENALSATWGWGALDRLPEPYAATFRTLWNAWLRDKYGDTERLRAAWNAKAVPLGAEILQNGDFRESFENGWFMERDEKTDVRWSVEQGGRAGRSLRVVVKRQGEVSWHPQFVQAGFAVRKNEPYTLEFQARSDARRQVYVNCMMAHEPWDRLGFESSVELGPQWQRFRFTFVASRDDGKARISVSGLEPGTYEFAGFSLRPGGVVGVGPSETLEANTVPVLRHGEMSLTEPARNDFIDFLWDAEAKYWGGMYRFLKDELKVQPLVAGTQMGYSPPHLQSRLDYVDAHSYWHHPAFPGRPWDGRNWYVENQALVNHPAGTLGGLAATRVEGKAYTVSEYNHPQPNSYAPEGFPMIAAFGALQGWSAIYSFAYCHNAHFEPRKIESYFDIKSDTAKMAHMPACAALFLRGDASEAQKLFAVPLSRETERRVLHQTRSAWSLTAEKLGLDPRWSLVHRIALDLTPLAGHRAKHGRGRGAGGERASIAGEEKRFPNIPEKTTVFQSDTGQLRWDISTKGAGYFTADTPRTKLFTGFVAGRTFDLGPVKLRIGQTRLDWATVSMVAIDGKGFDKPGRILIAATGWEQNSDAKLESLGGSRVTLRDRWGREPILCEGVPAAILLPVEPDRVTFYPLDESGNRRPSAPVAGRDGKTLLTLGPQHKTVWYEVEIR
jgi:hypothetical protein